MDDTSLKLEPDVTVRAGPDACGPSLAQLRRLSCEELIADLKAGHQDALSVLFDRYHRLVLSIARKFLPDSGEAEDLMQSVFFEISQKVAHFDPARGTVKGWIARCAYHRSLNRRHYLNVRAAFGEVEINEAVERELASVPRATAGLTDPEARRLVEQGLAILNPHQRETLTLIFFEGLSMSEIAARRRETVVNVRHYYYRGLDKLREFLYRER